MPRWDPNEYFTYDPATGVVLWKRRDPATMYHGESWNRKFAEKQAGCINPGDGYRYIALNIGGERVWRGPASRIAWAIMTGKDIADAPKPIDHENGVHDDNRWINLRPATYSNNNHNQALKSSNSTGYKWVSIDNGEYRATVSALVTINGKRVRKYFDKRGFETAEEAHAAALAAAKELHNEFAFNGMKGGR